MDKLVHNSGRFTSEAMVAVTAITETTQGEQARRDVRAASAVSATSAGRTQSDASATSATSSALYASAEPPSGAAEAAKGEEAATGAGSGEYSNTHKTTSDMFTPASATKTEAVPRPLNTNTLAEQLIGEQVGPVGETRTTIGTLTGRRLGSWLFKKGRQWPKNWQKRFFVLRGLQLSWYVEQHQTGPQTRPSLDHHRTITQTCHGLQ